MTLSPRAQKAFEVLSKGGKFCHALERDSYAGREKFKYRLQDENGYVVNGFGIRAFDELHDAGMLCVYNYYSTATYWTIREDRPMLTVEQKKEKILAAIAARGWFTPDIFWKEACELRDAGLIKLGEQYFTGGNCKLVWVKADKKEGE